MATIKLTRPRGCDGGLVVADGVEIGTWQLRRWVIGRSNLYTASLEGGETVSATTLTKLQRQIERLCLRRPPGNPKSALPQTG